MKPTVYIETTIPSYYVARESRNIIQLARQQLTREWWDRFRGNYDIYTSQIVLEEAADGDGHMSEERLALLEEIPLLDIDELVEELAQELVGRHIIPEKAARDALHIAAASVQKMDYLLTWNCTHIANPHIQQRIRACFLSYSVEIPVICTPEEFIGDGNEPEN
jgi:predicted nucleic acid-binding protein